MQHLQTYYYTLFYKVTRTNGLSHVAYEPDGGAFNLVPSTSVTTSS